jgi:hypothetical protein
MLLIFNKISMLIILELICQVPLILYELSNLAIVRVQRGTKIVAT